MRLHRADTWSLIEGDCIRALRAFASARFDSIVTDPPYEIGFMAKGWDRTGIAYSPELWAEALRVLKPGGHLLSFGANRTSHRMTCAIEDAGFEIRDVPDWLYGTGFPKSLNVGREIDMCLCSKPGRHYDKRLPPEDKRQRLDHLCPAHPLGDPWRNHGTALKSGKEPITLGRKPLIGTVAENVLKYGTGALNIDACRLGRDDINPSREGEQARTNGVTSLRPEAGPRGGSTLGRWPANVLLDESTAAELDAQSGTLTSGLMKAGQKRAGRSGVALGVMGGDVTTTTHADSGGASRFFYVAKPSRAERDAGCGHLEPKSGGEATDREDDSAGTQNPRAGAGRTGGARNYHPTVKPITLMRYLVRLVTPPGGTVLDPFTGSGTTGMAARLERFDFIGIEREPEYFEIAKARIAAASP